jgi:hypothetical protein
LKRKYAEWTKYTCLILKQVVKKVTGVFSRLKNVLFFGLAQVLSGALHG